MPLNESNSKSTNRTVYGGNTHTVFLYKRGNDQKQGTVVQIRLFRCRRSMMTRTGEPLQDEMTSNHRTVWHIPGSELKRVGVHFLSSADRIFWPKKGEWWQPESDTIITAKLFGNEIDVDCLRCDPPKGA